MVKGKEKGSLETCIVIRKRESVSRTRWSGDINEMRRKVVRFSFYSRCLLYRRFFDAFVKTIADSLMTFYFFSSPSSLTSCCHHNIIFFRPLSLCFLFCYANTPRRMVFNWLPLMKIIFNNLCQTLFSVCVPSLFIYSSSHSFIHFIINNFDENVSFCSENDTQKEKSNNNNNNNAEIKGEHKHKQTRITFHSFIFQKTLQYYLDIERVKRDVDDDDDDEAKKNVCRTRRGKNHQHCYFVIRFSLLSAAAP